jgi:uncharacterized membrane protein YoaK (UPF0700 family)
MTPYYTGLIEDTFTPFTRLFTAAPIGNTVGVVAAVAGQRIKIHRATFSLAAGATIATITIRSGNAAGTIIQEFTIAPGATVVLEFCRWPHLVTSVGQGLTYNVAGGVVNAGILYIQEV